MLANLPLVQTSGMGLNAFFVYTVCIGFGLSYANALVLILLEGSVTVMPFISYGIAFGMISYVVISVFSGGIKKIKAGSWVITFLFIAMLFLTH